MEPAEDHAAIADFVAGETHHATCGVAGTPHQQDRCGGEVLAMPPTLGFIGAEKKCAQYAARTLGRFRKFFEPIRAPFAQTLADQYRCAFWTDGAPAAVFDLAPRQVVEARIDVAITQQLGRISLKLSVIEVGAVAAQCIAELRAVVVAIIVDQQSIKIHRVTAVGA